MAMLFRDGLLRSSFRIVKTSEAIYERASPTATEILTGLSRAQVAKLTRRIRDHLLTYASPDGVTMPDAAWLVTAEAA
jgi:hypothetical protein